MEYLKGKRVLNITLRSDNLNVIKWYVNESFATHHYCHGHTGAMMAPRSTWMNSLYRNHKLNEKSSTEIELIGLNNALPSIL